jgi:hypothetical protein
MIPAWPLRHLPDDRGRGTERIVPGDSAADHGIAPPQAAMPA